MKKYNKKLLLDYVWGNEIIGYDIDELENDYEFMVEVIKYTKDKKMYNLCSSEVKNNYIFIRFMVETFIDDIKFVTSIANKYLESLDGKDITSRELTVLISEHITRNQAEEDMDLFPYKADAAGFYELECCTFSHLIENVDDEEIKKEYGLGFLYFFEKYDSSKIICNFFAKKLLETIFYANSDCSLEELFHKHFKSFAELESYGTKNFLLQHIGQFDRYLSDYLRKNIQLLNVFNKQISRIEKNWDNYIERINMQKVDIYNDELFTYMENNQSSISVIELTIYAIRKLRLEEIFYKYDPHLKKFSEEMPFEIERIINNINDQSTPDINDYKCITYAINLAKNLFKSNIIENNINDYREKTKYKNQKSKVLKVDFKTKSIESQ